MDNQFIIACQRVDILNMDTIKKLYRQKKQLEINGKFERYLFDDWDWNLFLLKCPEV